MGGPQRVVMSWAGSDDSMGETPKTGGRCRQAQPVIRTNTIAQNTARSSALGLPPPCVLRRGRDQRLGDHPQPIGYKASGELHINWDALRRDTDRQGSIAERSPPSSFRVPLGSNLGQFVDFRQDHLGEVGRDFAEVLLGADRDVLIGEAEYFWSAALLAYTVTDNRSAFIEPVYSPKGAMRFPPAPWPRCFGRSDPSRRRSGMKWWSCSGAPAMPLARNPVPPKNAEPRSVSGLGSVCRSASTRRDTC
jgi:hypothetical protein